MTAALATTHTCKVCGRPVDPRVDVLFGALGRPLFAAHTGECANTVRAGTQAAGALAKGLLQARAPTVARFLDLFTASFRHHKQAQQKADP